MNLAQVYRYCLRGGVYNRYYLRGGGSTGTASGGGVYNRYYLRGGGVYRYYLRGGLQVLPQGGLQVLLYFRGQGGSTVTTRLQGGVYSISCPRSSRPYNCHLCRILKNYDRALQYFRHAQFLDSESSTVYTGLGQYYLFFIIFLCIMCALF